MSISAAPTGRNVGYFDSAETGAPGYLIVHREDDEGREALGAVRLRRNITHLVKIIIPRRAVNDEVFKLGQPA